MPGIGNAIGIPFKKGGGISWSSYWTTLISATVENAAPNDFVLTFPTAKPTLDETDFTIAGFPLTGAVWVGAVLTLTSSVTVRFGDTPVITFVPSGGTANVTNNSLKRFLIDLTRNTDSVGINSINTPSNTTDYVAATAGQGDFILNRSNTDMMRQTDNILGMSLAKVSSLANVTVVRIIIWRKVGLIWNKVATSENLIGTIGTGLQTITLTTPLAVQEGDWLGYELTTSAGSANVFAADALLNGMYYNYNYGVPDDTNWEWVSKSDDSNFRPTSVMLAKAPLLCAFGDSIIEGYPLNYSRADPYAVGNVNDPPKSIWYKLRTLSSKVVYQNLGRAGYDSAELLAAIALLTAAKPKIAVIQCGVNDIADGVITKAAYLANMEDIFDACIAADIIPIVLSILSCTNLDATKSNAREDWNADLETLVATYPTAYFVDMESIMGQFRVGGDPGNLWDIKTAYDNDGTHLTEAGMQAVADEVYSLLSTEIV